MSGSGFCVSARNYLFVVLLGDKRLRTMPSMESSPDPPGWHDFHENQKKCEAQLVAASDSSGS